MGEGHCLVQRDLGIVFFGVPLRGSEVKQLGHQIAQVSRILEIGKRSIIKDRRPSLELLVNLLERFLTIFGDKRDKIYCLYEERKTDFVKSKIFLWPLRWAVIPWLLGSHPNT